MNILVQSNSIAQFSGVVIFVPAVSLIGAVLAVAVPALRWRVAVGDVTPIPKFPELLIRILSESVLEPSGVV